MPAGAEAARPPARRFEQRDTHRLIPAKYSEGQESVLTRIADDDAHLHEIFELDDATNDRLIAEQNRLPGIGLAELVSGFPHYRIVNAAFCHPHPLGSRFNGPDRGAWYAGFDVETSQAEVAFHMGVALAEIGWPKDSVTYDDYLADFTTEFHDLRAAPEFARCLDPNSYVKSQAFAARLLAAGAAGIVYPSVRHPSGTCLACFRPALVNNVRKQARYRFAWARSERLEIFNEERYI